MERLTKMFRGQNMPNEMANEKCKDINCVSYCFDIADNCEKCEIRKCFDRLADYEDTGYSPDEIVKMAQELEELKKQLPPCKIGDTVYDISLGVIEKGEVYGYSIELPADGCIHYRSNGCITSYCFVEDIGGTVFFSQEETEEQE